MNTYQKNTEKSVGLIFLCAVECAQKIFCLQTITLCDGNNLLPAIYVSLTKMVAEARTEQNISSSGG